MKYKGIDFMLNELSPKIARSTTLHKGHCNLPQKVLLSVRVFIQYLAAIDTLDYYHLYY